VLRYGSGSVSGYVNRIATKIQSFVRWPIANLPWKFHENPFGSFCAKLLTDDYISSLAEVLMLISRALNALDIAKQYRNDRFQCMQFCGMQLWRAKLSERKSFSRGDDGPTGVAYHSVHQCRTNRIVDKVNRSGHIIAERRSVIARRRVPITE